MIWLGADSKGIGYLFQKSIDNIKIIRTDKCFSVPQSLILTYSIINSTKGFDSIIPLTASGLS